MEGRGEYERSLLHLTRQKATWQTVKGEKHPSPLCACTCERNITVIKEGATVVTPNPHLNPRICQQTTHNPLQWGWLCMNIFAHCDCQLSASPLCWESEQTCPAPLWASSKPKTERCMTKGGKRAVRKVKKSRVKFESFGVQTGRTNRLFVSIATETSDIHLYNCSVRNCKMMQT